MYLMNFKLNRDWLLKINWFHAFDTDDYDVRINIQWEITETTEKI